jgi:hypothetical protein
VAGPNREVDESRTDPKARQALAEIADLHCEFPAWAIWLPRYDHGWTALRPASSRAPESGLPMIWVHTTTAVELADRMRAADATLTGHDR